MFPLWEVAAPCWNCHVAAAATGRDQFLRSRTQQLKKVPTNHVCGVTHSRAIPCQSPSPGSCFSGGSLTAGLKGKLRVEPFTAEAMRGVNLSLSTFFRQSISPQRLARQTSLYPASLVATMATAHGSSTASSPPWYAAYPPPRHLQPGYVTREELLSMLKDGENVTANDFVLVDLRRADHEVSLLGGTWCLTAPSSPRAMPYCLNPPLCYCLARLTLTLAATLGGHHPRLFEPSSAEFIPNHPNTLLPIQGSRGAQGHLVLL